MVGKSWRVLCVVIRRPVSVGALSGLCAFYGTLYPASSDKRDGHGSRTKGPKCPGSGDFLRPLDDASGVCVPSVPGAGPGLDERRGGRQDRRNQS